MTAQAPQADQEWVAAVGATLLPARYTHAAASRIERADEIFPLSELDEATQKHFRQQFPLIFNEDRSY